MSSDLPLLVQTALDDYIDQVHSVLPGLVAGLYVHGSVALGTYQPGLSDIDFIVVTSRTCTDQDIAALRAIHQALTTRHPRAPLEGSYLQWQDLGQRVGHVPPRPYIHDGVFYPGGHHDINAVTWWILKNRGVTLLGPPANQLDIQVDWDGLVAAMHRNMNTYWASFTSNPRRMAWLLGDYGVQWAVLGVLRQFYTFREQSITSKVGAGVYGLAHTPRRWHRLIQEAIDIREGRPATAYRSHIVRAIETRAFLQLVIAACQID
jgi:hypothetical protein